MQSFLYVFLIILLSCKPQSSHHEKTKSSIVTKHSETEAKYTWEKLLDSAEWRKNYNFQMFSTDEQLFVFHPDGTWQSKDGKNWEKTGLTNPVYNHAFLDYVFFKGSVYGLGHFKGNIETFEYKPEIYRSTHLTSWDTISKNSNLPPRFFYHPFEFKDKLWIIGGEDKNGQYNDIWNSEDAIHWTRQKENLPFGKVSGSRIVELNEHLYLLNNDVWKSSDGLTWTKVADEIVRGEQIFGYAALAFDDHIWLLGCNRDGKFSSEVLYSKDGKIWKTMSAPWLPRGGIAAVEHQGKIYMTGGKYGGTPNHPDFRYDNDVWVLSKG